MYFCDNCDGKRFASRTLYLLHLSECTKKSATDENTDNEGSDSNEVSSIIK